MCCCATLHGGSGVVGDALPKSRFGEENGFMDVKSDLIPPAAPEDGFPTGNLKGVKESSDSMDLEVSPVIGENSCVCCCSTSTFGGGNNVLEMGLIFQQVQRLHGFGSMQRVK